MTKPIKSDLVALQYRLWKSYGEHVIDPQQILLQLCKTLIETLALTSVSLLQKKRHGLLKAETEHTYPESAGLARFPDLQKYRDLATPTQSAFIESVTDSQDCHWYCFSLEGMGFLILEASDQALEDDLIDMLTYTFGRFRHEYIGRLLQQYSDENHDKIRSLSESLQSEKNNLEQILGAISDGVVVLDWQGDVFFANPAAHSMFGLPINKRFEEHFTNYFRIYDINDESSLTKSVVEHCMARGSWESEEPVILRCGQLSDSYVRIVVRELGSAKKPPGSDSYFVCTFHDVTEVYQAEQKLKWQARHDYLTGCLNRRGFEETLRAIVSDDTRTCNYVLLCMDLDRFKHVNDIAGHMAGDALLKHVSTLMQQEIRDTDQLARVGGDEFCIILADCNEKKATNIAERIRKQIDRLRFKWERNIFTLGVSLGLTVIELADDNAELVHSRADEACNHSKENGRNQVSCAPRSSVKSSEGKVRESELQVNYLHYVSLALSESDASCRLVLFRQNIRAITSEYSNHQEVLLRIKRNGELISPNSFLPAAERCGKVADIDIWVLSNTLDYLMEHNTCNLNVNLSGVTLSNDKACRKIYEILLAYPVQAKCLCLEITETAAITNLGKCTQFMEKLHRLGVTFALDDFGTGVSSFGYLKSLPVKYLKIDGSFIRDLCDNEVDEILVQSIISAAKAMKIRTVAEYVSNEEILDKLRAMGVDYAQGYCLGEPEPMYMQRRSNDRRQEALAIT